MSDSNTSPVIDTSANLTSNHYRIDKAHPHIVIIDNPDMAEVEKLLLVCPAGLYQLNHDGSLQFDYAGCLECGACQVLCGTTIIQKWQYPQGGFGVVYCYG